MATAFSFLNAGLSMAWFSSSRIWFSFCCNFSTWFCFGKTHFCGSDGDPPVLTIVHDSADACHQGSVWPMLVDSSSGKNKKKIHEYSQCDGAPQFSLPLTFSAGIRAKIQAIKDNNDYKTEEARDKAYERCFSDPKGCPLGLRHPASGWRFLWGFLFIVDALQGSNLVLAAVSASRKKRKSTKWRFMLRSCC